MIKANIKKMEEYKPPLEGRASKKYLLLDFNERTSAPSLKVKRALKNFIDKDKLQTYPEYGDLDKKIANYAKVRDSQVMVTNGSDQAIDIIFRAYVGERDKVIIPSPSFAMFYQSAEIQGANILKPFYKKDSAPEPRRNRLAATLQGKQVRCGASLSFPLKETLDLINTRVKPRSRESRYRAKLIVICNPNNPTGTPLPIKDVEKILRKAKKKGAAVLHDEAYFEFCGITDKSLVAKYDNLYITRTFSKAFGLPSIRAGYVLSQKKNIQELLKIRGPYDVSMFAKTAILAALNNAKYMKDYVGEVMKKSKPRFEKFLRERRITFFSSAANFLLVKIPHSEKTYKTLKSQGILVRPREGPNINKTIRISVGNKAETNQLIDTLNKIM